MRIRHLAVPALIPTAFLLGTLVNTGFTQQAANPAVVEVEDRETQRPAGLSGAPDLLPQAVLEDAAILESCQWVSLGRAEPRHRYRVSGSGAGNFS